jgi:hypothetical protein
MLPPRAYTFIGLNIARALSLVALVLVFASSIVVLVHDVQVFNVFINTPHVSTAGNSTTPGNATTDDVNAILNGTAVDSSMDYIPGSTIPNQPAGIFVAVLNRLLIIFQVIVLILSECSWPMKFFNCYFPVLGDKFGTGALGVIQCLIGSSVLSHHVDTFSLVSAFFLFSVGCLNILIGLIWRQNAKSKRSITSFRNKSKEILPTTIPRPMTHASEGSSTFVSHMTGSSKGMSVYMYDEKTGQMGYAHAHGQPQDHVSFAPEPRAETPSSLTHTPSQTHAGMGFGRQGEKAAALKGFLINKPVESLPRYVPNRGSTVSVADSDKDSVRGRHETQ